jgi:hypothetical protein
VRLGLSGTAKPVTGTLLDSVRGISGSLAASCDLNGSAQADVKVTGTKIEIAKIAGNFGTQTCNWNASLSNGGRISGTLAGSGIGIGVSGGATPGR